MSLGILYYQIENTGDEVMAETNPLIQVVQNPRMAVIFLGKTPKEYLVSLNNVASNVLRTYNIYKGWNQPVKSSIEKFNLFGALTVVTDQPTKDSESLVRRFHATVYSYSEFTYRLHYLTTAYEVLEYIKNNLYDGDLNIPSPFPDGRLLAFNKTDKFFAELPVSPTADVNINLVLEDGKYDYSVPYVKDFVVLNNKEIIDKMGEGFDRVYQACN